MSRDICKAGWSAWPDVEAASGDPVGHGPGLSQAETARLYGLSEATVSRLLARYRTDGDAAFETRSRRPGTSPTKTPTATVEAITNLRIELTAQGLDAGPETIAWHLWRRHGITVSISTIRRYLLAAGLVTPEPRKRPRASYIRFQAELPNETWQSDFTHWGIAAGSVDISYARRVRAGRMFRCPRSSLPSSSGMSSGSLAAVI